MGLVEPVSREQERGSGVNLEHADAELHAEPLSVELAARSLPSLPHHP